MFLQDATEWPIARPSDRDDQRACYSGKHKNHTLKTLIVIDEPLTIRLATPLVVGRCHDKRLADETGYTLPSGSELLQDLGFQGFRLADVVIVQPHKKLPKGVLSGEQKAAHRAIASRRVRVEHVIGSVKRYRVVKERLRLWSEGIADLLMSLYCGLHDGRIHLSPWKLLR
ncbi:MAG: transposase family protein [Candidatus Competibacterales bacterium]